MQKLKNTSLLAYSLFRHDNSGTATDREAEEISAESKERTTQRRETQKELAEKWRQLTEEERQAYKTKAVQLREAQAKEEAEGEHESPAPRKSDRSISHKGPVNPLEDLFPPSRMKKILKLDPDCPKITAPAARVMNVAAVLLLQRLAKTARTTSRGGRATLKHEDLLAAIRRGDASTKFFQSLTYTLDDDADTNEAEDSFFSASTAFAELQKFSAASAASPNPSAAFGELGTLSAADAALPTSSAAAAALHTSSAASAEQQHSSAASAPVHTSSAALRTPSATARAIAGNVPLSRETGGNSSALTSRKHRCGKGRGGAPQKKQCADITSFFRPRQQ